MHLKGLRRLKIKCPVFYRSMIMIQFQQRIFRRIFHHHLLVLAGAAPENTGLDGLQSFLSAINLVINILSYSPKFTSAWKGAQTLQLLEDDAMRATTAERRRTTGDGCF